MMKKIFYSITLLSCLSVLVFSTQVSAQTSYSSSLPVAPASVVPSTPVPTPTPTATPRVVASPVAVASPVPEMPVSASGDWMLYALLGGGVMTCVAAGLGLKVEKKD